MVRTFESKLLSVHIEKAAGTSVQGLLETLLGKNRVLVYNPLTDSLVRASDLRAQRTNTVHDQLRLKIANSPLAPAINRLYLLLISNILKPKFIQVSNLPDDFVAIHGHYCADRFDQYIKKPLLAVVVREPLQRMESQYTHWRNTKGMTEWRKRVPYDPTLSFEEYALLPELQNYQTGALAGKDLNTFRCVGVTDEIDSFARQLITGLREEGVISNKHGDNSRIRWLNRTPGTQESVHTHSQAFLDEFKSVHTEDYQLYARAKDRIKMRS